MIDDKVFCPCPTGGSSSLGDASTFGQSLEAQLEVLVNRSLAPSAAAAYWVGILRYLAFCHKLQVRPVPASKHRVTAFTTYLWSTVTLPTIRVYLAAVSFLHHVKGLRSPMSANPTRMLLLRGIWLLQGIWPSQEAHMSITPRIPISATRVLPIKQVTAAPGQADVPGSHVTNVLQVSANEGIYSHTLPSGFTC